MTVTITTVSHWKPSLTENDVAHLKARSLFGSVIKGSPYTAHLKLLGQAKALCGKQPGKSTPSSKMKPRSGWVVYRDTFEQPGMAPCEACLKAAEAMPPSATPAAQKENDLD